MKNCSILIFILLLSIQSLLAQDKEFIRNIYNKALSEGNAYQDLKELCKNIGPRLSGSLSAEMAVRWAEKKLKSYHFDTVYLQEIKVPHWSRGTKEKSWLIAQGKEYYLDVLALGGSISTNGIIEGELVYFESFEDLKESNLILNNKIVFVNQSMNQNDINTFSAYGACYPMRGDGASIAAKKGAKAYLIRSISSSDNNDPHTGSLHYEKGFEIPAAALSTNSANLIKEQSKKDKVFIKLEMDCKQLEDVTSYNVIAEIKGTKYPNKIITFGGHLDSWDVGEGAHDDGAGIVHSIEALRILKSLSFKPNHTLRVVCFMNEENGNKGGLTYASWVKEKNEEHVAAIESDRGGFVPKGFSCDGNIEELKKMFSFSDIFKPYELYEFEKGYGGVDINPLKKEFPNIYLFGLVTDSQRYFEHHHAASDVFETVNKRELALGCGAIASFIYVLDELLN